VSNIRTKPSTPEYRKAWTRIFGKGITSTIKDMQVTTTYGCGCISHERFAPPQCEVHGAGIVHVNAKKEAS